VNCQLQATYTTHKLLPPTTEEYNSKIGKTKAYLVSREEASLLTRLAYRVVRDGEQER
jgi:hypothetical protein